MGKVIKGFKGIKIMVYWKAQKQKCFFRYSRKTSISRSLSTIIFRPTNIHRDSLHFYGRYIDSPLTPIWDQIDLSHFYPPSAAQEQSSVLDVIEICMALMSHKQITAGADGNVKCRGWWTRKYNSFYQTPRPKRTVTPFSGGGMGDFQARVNNCFPWGMRITVLLKN